MPERLQELAVRADKVGRSVFTPFLTPPEAQNACAIGKRQRVAVTLYGGCEDAERQMAGFFPEGSACETFPIATIKVAWSHQAAPSHRDLLGSVMALGIRRQMLGDIVLLPECAYLFAQEAMAQHIAGGWLQAGSAHLRAEIVPEMLESPEATGVEKRDTVASLRLDAIIAGGLHMSRAKAADLIHAGYVKLRYLPVLRSDAQVECGDMISVRGMGRLRLMEAGSPTRKGRIPITLMRFGSLKSK